MKRFNLKFLKVIFLFILINGCASNRENSQSYLSEITLKNKIPIAKGYARIFLQDGKTSIGVDRYEHSCEIEVNDVSVGTDFISADTFIVTGVSHRTTTNELTGFSAPVFGNCSETIFYETYFKLFSDKQPNVRNMVCREGFNSCSGHFASKEKIKKTLGSGFTIK